MESGAVLTSWHQAFEEHRIPTTRAIEKQLRANASRDKEKLRGLVGGSYREFLATAEAIVVLEEKAQAAEWHISSISHDCRPPQYDSARRPLPTDKVTLAQFRLLHRCYTTSVTCLQNQDILKCSKLTLLSRLLLRSLGNESSLSSSLEHMRGKLGALRQRLLRQVNAKLVNPASSVPGLVDAVCSYCLVTDVSSSKALDHLRERRLDKLRRQLGASRNRSAICEALRYQLVSLQLFKTLTGHPVSEAVNNLQRKAILADPALRELESLDLDRTWPLLPEEIQTFVPYFQRTASTSEEMHTKLETWSKESCGILEKAINEHLAGLNDAVEVLELRRELFTLLLPMYFSTPASRDISSCIRKSLNDQMRDICQDQGSRLNKIAEELVTASRSSPSSNSLWSPEMVQTPLDQGGSKMIKRLKVRHSGLNKALSKATKALDDWVAGIHTAKDQINELSKIRWRDMMEEPDEEEEDEATLEVRMLCEDDPDYYSKNLQESARKAVSGYEECLVTAASEVIAQPSDLSRVVYVVRAIRISAGVLYKAFPEETHASKVVEKMHDLHKVVADEVVRQLKEAGRGNGRAPKCDTSQLPEGMPSPKAFMALRRLCRVMADIGGTDIWTMPAVTLVKKAVAAEIFDPESKGNYVDTDFDEAYFRVALQDGSDIAKPKLTESEKTQQAIEYWTRTKLLFGMIA
ncbi:hypothetical protein LTS17_009831 [Exophiala oligosperma]